MTLAILGDIHGNLPALNIVKEKINEFSPDFIVCLGDIVGYYPWPIECTQYVMKNCSPTILGNHDQVVLADDFENKISWFNEIAEAALKWCRLQLFKPKNSKEANFLRDLPLKKEIMLDKFKMLFIHGTPDDPWDYFMYYPRYPRQSLESRMRGWLKYEKKDLIAVGHTHVPFVYHHRKKVFLNPGSVGQPRDGNPDASFVIVDIGDRKISATIHRVSYDINETAEGVKNAGLPDSLAQRLFKGH